MVSFFHAYDLRGKFPGEIGLDEARKVGKAYGTWTDSETVLVGRDGRKHGGEVTAAFIEGLESTGLTVLDAGMVPSPVLYYGVMSRSLEAGAVVTASHNPSEYTGFKFCGENALAISREGGMADIEDIYVSEDFDGGDGEVREVELMGDYIDAVEEVIGLEKDVEVAVNFGNGVTSVLGKELLERIGCSVKTVNGEIDGDFPSHLPDPGSEEAREQLESEMDDEDLGIIFDGDGDRAGFMLPGYGYIPEDEVLALFSEEVLSEEKGRVVHDLRASKLVGEKIKESGGEAVESRVGHTFISEKIHSDPGIVFAGELSGHYYFPHYGFPFDDGLFAACLMCRIVSKYSIRERLESFPDYPVSPELRVDCPNSIKEKVVEDVKNDFSDMDVSELDGIKIDFGNGWALVRPSNTEPKMSVRVEADTEDALEDILDRVEGSVKDSIAGRR